MARGKQAGDLQVGASGNGKERNRGLIGKPTLQRRRKQKTGFTELQLGKQKHPTEPLAKGELK